MSHDTPFALPLLLEETAPSRLPTTFERGLARTQPGESQHGVSTLSSALDRLAALIEEETEALRARTPLDFAEISRRKSRSLLELTRIARAVPPRVDAATAEQIRHVREALANNLRLLGIHLAAAEEIGEILSGAIRDAESDGTYSTVPTCGRPA
ncbi:hypothetical protein [Aquabacter spiritensis]|uniref:FlgN protein n=1 Tax=Aquabacter spiritensis TaxID=933073 RepID=A0A4R3M511_9HYPH|nr:hypothetical protein [Aquabacter spiritensis]TCT07956.1 hypothetical protein EDC64_101475 [Aquabacter spiritensis]